MSETGASASDRRSRRVQTSVRPPLWRDIRVLRVAAQAFALVAVVTAVSYLLGNLRTNLHNAGISTGFDFLDQPARFTVRGSGFRSAQPVRDLIKVGVRNTFSVAIVGVVVSTVLGTIVGVMRLSSNWLVRKLAAFYVETIRNIPPLLVIVFVFLAVLLPLPVITEAHEVWGVAVVSNRDLAVTSFASQDGAPTFVWVMLVAAIVAAAVGVWRTRVSVLTGQPHHRILWGAAIVGGVGIVSYLALAGPYALSRPVLDGRVIRGGVSMTANYAALTIALSVYTASHIAEIVRGSIQAVARGQTEAASALALSDFQRLRFVVLPQAFRIAIPPLINQYLNLTKNTSLGIVIAFPEATQLVVTAIGNSNPAPQLIAILMAIYLAFSITISVFVNLLSRRLQQVGR